MCSVELVWAEREVDMFETEHTDFGNWLEVTQTLLSISLGLSNMTRLKPVVTRIVSKKAQKRRVFFSLQDKTVAFKIFELGLKKFGEHPEYICAYLEFMSHLNGKFFLLIMFV